MTISGTNISMTRGDTETLTVRCSKPFAAGDTVYFTVRQDMDSPVALQIQVTEFSPEGAAVIVIEHEDTEIMEFGDYRYDIQVTRESGAVTTLVKPSRFTLEEEITYD